MLHLVQTCNFPAVRGAHCTLPHFIENTGTADCCAPNCSRTNTNPKHKAAPFQRTKVNVSEAEAPANGRRQQSEAACQLQLVLRLGISFCHRMQMFEKENVTMW